MRKETIEAKLNALLGITTKVEELKTKTTGKIIGMSEDEIQDFRSAQGLLYFLQAPELFTSKVCPHCKEQFLVSRKYVAYCSYTCIRNSLAEQGIQWKKGQDLETLAQDPQVFNGNEPIWIRKNMWSRLKVILDNLSGNSPSEDSQLKSSTEMTSPPTISSTFHQSLLTPGISQSSSPVHSTTSQLVKEVGNGQSVKKDGKPKITFGG